MAGRMIQGLRGIAPGGFGAKKPGEGGASTTNAPRTGPPRSSFARSPQSPGGQRQAAREGGQSVPRVNFNRGSADRSQQPQNRQRDGRSGPPSGQRREGGNGPPSGQRRDRDDRKDKEEVQNRPARVEGPSEQSKLFGFLAESTDATEDLEASRRVNEQPLLERYFAGKPVRFANAEEKDRVLKKAKTHLEKLAASTGKSIDTDAGLAPISQGHRQALAAKVVGGNYEAVKGVQGKNVQERTMAHVETSLQLNGGYNDAARQAMLDFLGQKWPGKRQARAS